MRDERGSASMLVVTMAAVLLLISVAAAAVVAVVVAHRSAQAAADLAALAGAQEVQGGGDGCRVAAQVAEANGTRLLECTARPASTSVEVAVDAPRWEGPVVRLRARARAGPALSGGAGSSRGSAERSRSPTPGWRR